MNRNSFKTGYRAFLRKPLLPSLNLFGLSLGIACSITISLYIYQENSYEKGFSDVDRIYRVEENFLSMGKLAWTSPNMPHVLDDLPIVQEHTRLGSYGGDFKVKIEEQSVKLDNVLLADNAFFSVFDFDFIQGDPASALEGPGSAVIEKETATRLFGTTDVLGKELLTEEFGALQITGLVERGQLKSHLDFELVLFQEKQAFNSRAWFGIGGYSYAKLSEGVSEEQFNAALRKMTEEEVFPVIYKRGLASDNPMSFDEWVISANKVSFEAKPIRDIYLNSNLQFELGANGDRQTRVTLSVIAIFILVIAVINFMNLSTANASFRAKEVGVKKVLGAGSKRLVAQFLSQSVLFTLLAAMIGSGLSELLISLINQHLGEVISLSLVANVNLILAVFVGMLLVGLMAGIYPAFYLSSVKSVPLLKGKTVNQFLNVRSAIGLRNGLVVFQFVISSALIASSILVFQQIKHLQQLDLGYDKDQVLVIDNAYELGENKEVFKNRLLQDAQIIEASFTMRVPADGANSTLSTMLDSETTLVFGQFIADHALAETLGLDLLEGEWFDEFDPKNDSLVVINESAAKAIGLDDPIGKVFGNYYRIKGVVKDFQFGNLREAIGPAIIFNAGDNYSRLALRLQSDDYQVAKLGSIWNEFSNEPIEVSYLRQKHQALVNKEKQATDGILVFTILAILIAVLGLFGLATFSAEQRKREFGVRRVLGADFKQLLGLFGLHFIKLISIAFLISIPIAYYGLNQWLDGFANRIEINVMVFVFAGALALVIAGLTLFSQSFRVSHINPVDTLRNE